MINVVVTEFTTHYRLINNDELNFDKLIDFLSVYDGRDGTVYPYGYTITDKVIIIPKIKRLDIEKCIYDVNDNVNVTFKNGIVFPSKPFSFKPELKVKLFDYQKDINDSVMEYFNNTSFDPVENKRYSINLKTGKGKSITSMGILIKLGVKAIVFVKNNRLERNFVEDMLDLTNIPADRIATFKSGGDFMMLEEAEDKPDVIIMKHATITRLISNYGVKAVLRVLMACGIGLKIYDEYDYEVKSSLKIDTYTSIKYNLYLTATDYKSSASENIVFQRIYKHMPSMGKEIHANETPNRHIHVGLAKEIPEKSTLFKIIRGSYFDKAAYMRWLVKRSDVGDAFLSYMIKYIIKPSVTTRDKVLIFGGLKENVDYLFAKLISSGVPKSELFRVYSDNTPEDKRKLDKNGLAGLEENIIISTSNSMGRGVNLKGIKHMIIFELNISDSASTQIYGRGGRVNQGTAEVYELISTFSTVTYRTVKNKRKVWDREFDEVNIHNLTECSTITDMEEQFILPKRITK